MSGGADPREASLKRHIESGYTGFEINLACSCDINQPRI